MTVTTNKVNQKRQTREEYLNPQLKAHAGLARKTKAGRALLARMRGTLNGRDATVRQECDSNSSQE